MARYSSAKQVQQEHLRVLGPELGPVYHALNNEVIWLHTKWKQYRLLFADSPERVQFLNSVAGFFFGVIQDVLWEDMVLHVARLTDPPQSVGKNNLTLLRLPTLIDDDEFSRDLDDLVKAVKRESSFAKSWRHKHLAHIDLSLAVDKGAEPLPGISRKHMEGVLSAIRAVLNKIEGHYWNTEVPSEPFIAHDDAERLVYWLEVGAKEENRRREEHGRQ